jgi:3-hydroxy acid dehydrogenase / malonic semialdehyde reductase
MKKIIISGSSSGIGRAVTLKLLELGYSVVGLSRNQPKFLSKTDHYHHYKIDFSDVHQAENVLKNILQEHDDVETIIANAGYGRFGNLEQFSTGQICDLMNVNFIGQVLLIKTFLPSLKKRKNGKIIIMGSESALSGAKQGSIYCAAKFALRGFSQSLRLECASSGIGVTLINPGLVNTPFFENLNFTPGEEPENSLLPEDIAEQLALLLQWDNRLLVEEINIQPIKPMIKKR